MAPKTVSVTYTGPFDKVEIPYLGAAIECERGGTVEVPAGVAGRPPELGVDDDGNEIVVDPGEGILAQVDIWKPARAPKTPRPSKTDGDDTATEESAS